MRIACYGLVDRKGGSVTAANFLMLRELLLRGHEIDFYTFEGFAYPEELFSFQRFRYVAVTTEEAQRVHERVPRVVARYLHQAVEQYCYHYINMPKLERRIAVEHAERPYDVMIFLGVPAQCNAPEGVPSVAWVQGPPQTEGDAIRDLRQSITQLCGWGLYIQLRAFYAFKKRRAMLDTQRAHVVICGSKWSKAQIVRCGISPERVQTLPYPIDLSLFCPQKGVSDPDRPFTFLWLGRLDPRKRVDLLLSAFALLVPKHPKVHLKIVGPVGYAAGYRRLIDEFPYPEYLTYIQSVNRQEIPALINEADIVVQPSQNENFGSAVAEALCCGTPVILGPTNGTADYVKAGAFVFDSYTPESLRQTMEQALLSVRKNRISLVSKARAVAEAEFTVSDVVDRLEAILRGSTVYLTTPA